MYGARCHVFYNLIGSILGNEWGNLDCLGR